MMVWSAAPLSMVCRLSAWVFTLAVCLCLGVRVTQAQRIDFEQFPPQPLPDTAAPLFPAYGFNDDEYSVGAYVGTRDTNGSVQGIWNWLDSLGIRILELRLTIHGADHHYDTLANLASGFDTTERKFRQGIIVSSYPFDAHGWGKQVAFFAFDSSESYYRESKFLRYQGGAVDTNATELYGGRNALREAVYDTASTTPNDTVLSQIVVGYDSSWQKYRFQPDPASEYEDSTQVSGDDFFRRIDLDKTKRYLYFVVAGHLFDPNEVGSGGGGALDSDTLLAIDIWNEIPKGTTYLAVGESSPSLPVPADTTFRYMTLYVLKSTLKPTDTATPNFNAYRDTAMRLDMVRLGASGLGGPWNAANTSHRFDIRVRWTGKEKVALRSITVRDTWMQLLHGTDSVSIKWRDSVMLGADMVMRGPDYSHYNTVSNFLVPDTTRPRRIGKILRLYTGDEGYYLTNHGFSYLDSAFYRRYRDSNFIGADSIAYGVRAWRAQWGTNPHQYVMSSQPELSVETYPHVNTPETVVEETAKAAVFDGTALHRRFGLPWGLYAIPSIEQHNGGKYGIPLLDLVAGRAGDRDSVEHYAMAWNRLGLGAYITGHKRWPYDDLPLNRLGAAAWASRRTGRRIIQWFGVQRPLYIRYNPNITDTATGHFVRDVTYSHTIEPAELLCMANVGLAYGVRGGHYSFLGASRNAYGREYVDRDTIGGPGHYGHNYEQDWGPTGFRTNDTLDTYSWIALQGNDHLYENFDTLRNFWTGWNTLPKKMKWLHRTWLDSISAYMRQLRWRDAYSYHYTNEQTWMEEWTKVPRSRPLPPWSVIASIRAYDRYGSMDSAMNTFVELGFFDTVKGGKRVEDKHFVYVVNRRTFERTNDIKLSGLDSLLALHLDSLAEVRRLELRFNMRHPDTTQYCYLRIREMFPDTTIFPMCLGPHSGLDTIIYADSVANLWLRPGGGTLLEITYAAPDTSLRSGLTAWNNQRHMVFDGLRYHMAYSALDTFISENGMSGFDTTMEYSVFYRRSLPVDSTIGSILWEPGEDIRVSLDSTEDLRRSNLYPSITYRIHRNDPMHALDTVVTIVWSSASGTGERRIWLRNIRSRGGALPERAPVEFISAHKGEDADSWGTPTVCRLNGGDVVAWSDSTAGIVAQLRRVDTNTSYWWFYPGTYSSQVGVSVPFSPMEYPYDQYPTMPAFAHVDGADSSVGIAWQQGIPASGRSYIVYSRLVDSVDNGTPVLNVQNYTLLSTTSDYAFHPSMDLWQEVWRNAYEGIAWEEVEQKEEDHTYRTQLAFRSLWDSSGTTWLWGLAKLTVSDSTETPVWIYPNTASLNRRLDTTDTGAVNYFATVYNRPVAGMQQATLPFDGGTFATQFPLTYAYGGLWPSGSASQVRQHARYSAVYEDHTFHTPSILRTTRQFFAKTRPTGYMARGREVLLRVNDTLRTGIVLVLDDVWRIDANRGEGVQLIERGSSAVQVDSLTQLSGLMRTVNINAHDSTTFGCTIRGKFMGDSGAALGMYVDTYVELVDSSNGVVIQQLDSFRISSIARTYTAKPEATLDLLSGTYYIRLRPVSSGLPTIIPAHDSRYAVAELASEVGVEQAAKLRRVERGAQALRLAVHPNPLMAQGELLFSLPMDGPVMLTLHDATGNEVVRLMDVAMMEAGRYALNLDTRGLAAGAYHVELRSGRNRLAVKTVIVH